MTAPAYDNAGSLYALGLRLTRLAADGSPLPGPRSCYVTNALTTMGLGLEYADGQEVEQRNGLGELCVYFQAPSTLTRGTVSDLQVCSPDPTILQFAIGGDLITRTTTAEVQSVALTGTPTGGTFTLSYGGQTTAPIDYDATNTEVQSALLALDNLPPGSVTVTGTGPWTVTFALAQGNPAQMTGSGAGLTGGTSPAVAVTTTTPGTGFENIGFLAPRVGSNPTPYGLGLDMFTYAMSDGAQAVDLPFMHWTLGRVFLRTSDSMSAAADSAMTPTFEGYSQQNPNWGSGPLGDWPFQSDRVWQYARIAELPDLTPGYREVAA